MAVAQEQRMISRYQQRKRAFNNILMFVGLMAMAMVAWLDYKNRLPERRPSNNDTPAVIDHISFNNAKGIGTVLSLENGQWFLQQPVSLPARNSRIDRLLELQSIDFEDGFAADDVNLEAAGLGTQARTLTLNKNNYHFGQIEPISSKRYIQLGQKVLLLDDRYLPLMDGGINALAQLQLPLQHISGVNLAGAAAPPDQLSLWQNAQAIGVRSASAMPELASSFSVSNSQWTNWSAWPDKGLWVLQPQSAGYEYLISAAQAATLGLTQ